MEFGNFLRRIFANAIDFLLLYVLYSLGLLLIIYCYNNNIDLGEYSEYFDFAILLPALILFSYMLSSNLQASLGKYLVGLKVVNAKDLSRISFKRAIFRQVSIACIVYAIILSSGFLTKFYIDIKGIVIGPTSASMTAFFIAILFVILLLLINVFMILFGKERASIFDRIAGTRVIRKQPSTHKN
jgi:uncharacterized RDD family membrane protein YckC